ncbi:MAG: hypothetical protein ABJB86_11985 [Bacteroidota bacterium]
MKHLLFTAWLSLLATFAVNAQNYQAIQGSSYAGALGVHNNPASIVNTPFSWDVVLLGAQLKNSTNAFSIHDYSYLSSPANSLYHIDNGQYSRKTNIDFNLNLLNARIALNRKSSIAFGANIRSYTNLQTSDYNYSDTSRGAADFLKINQGITSVNGKLLSSSWLEVYISYARTLSDNEFGRLNAGISVKVSRGISGAYANIDNVNFSQTTQNNTPAYSISSANILYGYSATYDHWQSSNSASQNVKELLSNAEGGASFDAGIEYLIKAQGTTSFNDEEDYFDYDWKIGLSLLDIGGSQYKYGTQSRMVSGIKTNIIGLTLDKTFDSTVNSVSRFNDSLATLVNIAQAQGKFTVINPMRMVVNVDHYLTGNFYINGELSVNIPLTSLKKGYLQVKEINLLTITPRWERKRYGFYLPIQFNNQHQFWMGAAVKAGPLLLGVHNLANLFGKTSTQNGGGYVALILRAPKGLHGKTDKRLDCPKPIW